MTGSISGPANSPGRSPPAVQGSVANSPRNSLPPMKTPKPPWKTPTSLVSPKYGEVPKDTGTHKTNIVHPDSTSIVHPDDTNGPSSPTKHGHLANVPSNLKQREQYKAHLLLDKDKLEKDRLMKRRFGYVRHNCYYKNLTEPPSVESPAWMDPKRKEFWRTDVEKVLRRDEETRRARQKELLGIWTNDEAWRRNSLQKLRNVKYQAYLDLADNMASYGCRPNISGAPHINIITRQPIRTKNSDMLDYKNEISEYKRAARAQAIREKSSGARNFNILNWMKNPPGPPLPPWPEQPPPPPPPPPDPKVPLNSSKGALSCGRVYGAFGTLNIP